MSEWPFNRQRSITSSLHSLGHHNLSPSPPTLASIQQLDLASYKPVHVNITCSQTINTWYCLGVPYSLLAQRIHNFLAGLPKSIHARPPLMRKSKVEPLVALVFGGPQVFVPLFERHSTPDLFSPIVAPFVVELDGKYEEGRPRDYTQEHFVACSVVRGIVGAVDLGNLLAPSRKRQEREVQILTLEEIMLPACTVILYRADPTVRVRTEPALREVIPTRV